jgi:hypothetical protein
VAPTGWQAGAEILIEATQDAAGSRTLSVNDGSGARSVEISPDASATTLVRLLGRTTTDLDVEVPGSGATGPQGTRADRSDRSHRRSRLDGVDGRDRRRGR